jgi:hypothetical protein
LTSAKLKRSSAGFEDALENVQPSNEKTLHTTLAIKPKVCARLTEHDKKERQETGPSALPAASPD